MQISGYGAVQSPDFSRTDRAASVRSSGGFEQALGNELGQKDQVSISSAAQSAQAAMLKTAQASPIQAAMAAVQAPSQSGVLSASEKTFFNDSFGTNVFGADAAKASGPVVSKQGATVLDSQEISFFQGAFGMNSQSGNSQASNYTRGGAYGRAYGQAAQAGSSLNRTV